MATIDDFPFLAPNITIIEEEDRQVDGIHTIGSNQIQVFPFEIENDDQLRVAINENRITRQQFTIRAWISETPAGAEIFFRFHPGTGGLSHLFFDKDIDPPPEPQKEPAKRNEFSQITYVPRDTLVPLVPGKYFYNVQNLEISPANDLDTTPNSYRISLTGPKPIC